MAEIKCPNCNEVFQVDESNYSKILKQVRDQEFNNDLNRYKAEVEERKKIEIEQALTKGEQEHEKKINLKQQEIIKLKSEIENGEKDKELAVSRALKEKEEEYLDKQQKLNDIISARDKEIIGLQAKIRENEKAKELAVSEIKRETAEEISSKNEKITELKTTIKNKEEELKAWKEYKAKQSSKEIGESLERYCSDAFNALRSTAFQSAYFEKDNNSRAGSKGDFIFRDYEDGTEFISIMFEMKNEADETATKHKNKDFFKKLDKDRKEKKCEYAILVSLLEADSDLYNQGIVDVSHEYEKMYVIRPQYFISMISILRNEARNSLRYKKELKSIKDKETDISKFEENLTEFKSYIARKYNLANQNFDSAIKEIDKAIGALQKVKRELELSKDHLRLATEKSDGLTIKKLTEDAPTVRKMFDNQQ